MRLQDLALENRTYNCLVREGLGNRFEDIGKYTIGDLLALKAFGAKCLLDLLSSLETALSRSDSLNSQLTHEAVALGRMPEASLIHFSDPRLGTMLRNIDSEADTLGDLAGRIIRRRVDPPDPVALAHQLYVALASQGHEKSGTQALILALGKLSGIDWTSRC